MRYKIVLLILCCLSMPAFAQTQSEMTRQACEDYTKADKALNAAYMRLKNTCQKDPAFLKQLKVTQQLWITLRDAEADLLYPLGPTSGTMQPLLRCAKMMEMTQKRTVDLKQWYKDAKDGIICNRN